MGKPKRTQLATAEQTATPPSALEPGEVICRVTKAEGNNLWSVQLPEDPQSRLLVELPSRFRSFIWIKRGGYVVINTNAFEDRDNKLSGEIVNIVRDEKAWRKQPYWPKEFEKRSAYPDESAEDSPGIGMPPSDDESKDD